MSDEKTVDRESTQLDDEFTVDSSTAEERETDDDLGDKLHQLKEHSLDSKSVEGEIKNVDEREGAVEFEIELLTNGNTVKEVLPIPEPWHENAKLARVLDEHGYGPAVIDMMEGERVRMTRNMTGQWQIADPRRGQLLKALRNVGLASIGLVVFFIGGIGLLVTLLFDSIIPLIITLFLLLPVLLAAAIGWAFFRSLSSSLTP